MTDNKELDERQVLLDRATFKLRKAAYEYVTTLALFRLGPSANKEGKALDQAALEFTFANFRT